jgi:hypothetical protein
VINLGNLQIDPGGTYLHRIREGVCIKGNSLVKETIYFIGYFISTIKQVGIWVDLRGKLIILPLLVNSINIIKSNQNFTPASSPKMKLLKFTVQSLKSYSSL